MLIPYQALVTLPADTLEELIKSYLFSQTEDGTFSALTPQHLQAAIGRCREALSRNELVVEYSEQDESIAIRPRQNTLGTHRHKA